MFPSLLRSLWQSKSISPDNIKAGFKKCGIMPWDPSQTPTAVYESAEFFDRPAPAALPDSPATLEPGSSFSTVQPDSSSLTTTQPGPSSSTPQPGSPSPSRTSTPQLGLSAPPLPYQSALRLPSPTKQTSIKDFFLKRLTPMLIKEALL